MKTIDYSYFIERYNAGEMDLVEKSWFEKELDGNESLQKELMLRKKIDNALINHDLINLRNKLAVLEKTRKEKLVEADRKKAIGIRFAAAVAGFIIIGSLIMLSRNHMSNNDTLYKNNFSAYEYQNISRSDVLNSSPEFAKALQLYEANNYSQAATLFKEYLQSHPEDMPAQLVYGVTEMQNGNYPVAESSFRSVINDNDNLYIDNAQWNLALCYVATGQNTQAIKELNAIVNSESIFSKKAKKLLRQIK
jgi:tetratricopeptide (TPR) repeat protein